jgi:LEA14-like dessication related protein
MLSRRRLVLLSAVLALGACAALKPKPPEVSLSAVRVIEIGLVEQRLALILRVQNPNGREFVITGLAYAAEVGGRSFAQGVSNQRTLLPGYGETLIEVPATARLANLLDGLLDGLDALFGDKAGAGAGEVDYRVRGTVELEGLGALPFDRRGKVRLGPQRKAQPEAGKA